MATKEVLYIDLAFWSASYDGRVIQWKGTFEGSKFSNLHNNTLYQHTNQVTGLVAHKNGILSVGMDDQLISTEKLVTLTDSVQAIPKTSTIKGKVQGLAKGLSVIKNTAIIASTNALQTIKISDIGLNPTTIKKGDFSSVASSEKYVVVGSGANAYVYKTENILSNANVEPIVTFKVKGNVTCVLITPDDEYVVTGSSERQVALHQISSKETVIDQWVFHSSKVTAISCSPEKIDGQWFIASGAVDGIILINRPDKPLEPKKVQPAHLEGVNCVEWLNTFKRDIPDPKEKDKSLTETVAVIKSSGGDASVKLWEIVL
eukprot:NODE_107_length_18988_cov_0.534491.p3 type:complete len:317 gc:universal NODE_107_length_18988_cov_0.534491:11071-12021(+)